MDFCYKGDGSKARFTCPNEAEGDSPFNKNIYWAKLNEVNDKVKMVCLKYTVYSLSWTQTPALRPAESRKQQ